MTGLYLAFAVFLLLNILAGLVRIVRGPTPADRMMAVHLFGTMGVAILLLLAQAFDRESLRDVALVFALLGGMALLAFVNRVWPRVDAPRDTTE